MLSTNSVLRTGELLTALLTDRPAPPGSLCFVEVLRAVGGRVELLVPFIVTPIPNTAKPLAVPLGDSPTSEALLHGLQLVGAAGGRVVFVVQFLAPRLAFLEMVASPEHAFLILSH